MPDPNHDLRATNTNNGPKTISQRQARAEYSDRVTCPLLLAAYCTRANTLLRSYLMNHGFWDPSAPRSSTVRFVLIGFLKILALHLARSPSSRSHSYASDSGRNNGMASSVDSANAPDGALIGSDSRSPAKKLSAVSLAHLLLLRFPVEEGRRI